MIYLQIIKAWLREAVTLVTWDTAHAVSNQSEMFRMPIQTVDCLHVYSLYFIVSFYEK